MLSFTLRCIMHLIVTYPHFCAFIMSTEIDDLDLDLDLSLSLSVPTKEIVRVEIKLSSIFQFMIILDGVIKIIICGCVDDW